MSSSSAGTLIVGASHAGVELASALRDRGYSLPITLLGAEKHVPYHRPPLSKSFLDGSATADSLVLRSADYYQSHDIDLVLGERIVDIVRSSTGGFAVAESGRTFPFETLALAVGAAPRPLPIEGADLDGVVYLRDADDAYALAARLRGAENVVVIGGGFIGLEAAVSCQSLGKRVCVLEAAPRLMGRAVGETTSDFFLHEHSVHGLDIRVDAKLSRLVGTADGVVSGVQLASGEVVAAEIVLIGIGVLPRIALADILHLQTGNGIVVDEHSLASDGRTIVIGDCASLPPYTVGDQQSERIRLESVNNAVEQAANAAETVCGRPTPYRIVPWFWSNQGALKLQMAGISTGFDEVVTRTSPGDRKLSIVYYRDGRIIAGDFVNHPADFMAVRAALKRGANIPPELAGDTSRTLKAIAAELV
ncbi:MAG: ferredoxin [Subtercola sp.]|nr:ferredoxin [Subtercola sp.]